MSGAATAAEHAVPGGLANPTTNPRDWIWLPAGAAYWIGFCPSVYAAAGWLARGNVRGAAAFFAACDAWLLTWLLLFLWAGGRHAQQRYPTGLAPYRGAFLAVHPAAGGGTTLPRAYPWGFFPFYLAFAFAAAYLAPLAGLLGGLLGGSGALALAALGPYLAVFLVQSLLETQQRWRSIVTPVVPVAFVTYRLWQLARGLWLLALVGLNKEGALPGGAKAILWTLLWLLSFWTFDSAVVMAYLPWTYNYQLLPVHGLRSKKD